jgi:perosamine synthetase
MVCLEMMGITEAVRADMMSRLRDAGVDTRPYFYPVSDMPMYEPADTPIAHDISRRGINLPSYTDLSEDDVRQICESVRRVLAELDVL